MDLTDKVAFITGGAQGIGKGLAEALLENGAKVYIGDINTAVGEATAKELGEHFGEAKVRVATLDVTDHQKFTDVFNHAVSVFGGVDIMVNNAGILIEDRWQETISINLMAMIHGTKLAVEHMRKDTGGRGGRIVNMCSNTGLTDFFPIPVYCATKHAIRAYTSSMASQPSNTERGIQYALICPGAVDTELTRSLQQQDWFKNLENKLSTTGMPVSRISDALIELLHLQNMNGSILHIEGTMKQYVNMQYKPVETNPK